MNSLDQYLCVNCQKCGWSYDSLRQAFDCYKCEGEE